MSKEGDKILWRGVRPTAPESIFTRHEKPDGCTYVFAYNYAINGVVTIYTVPADTVFYLTDYCFSAYATVAGYVRLYLYTAVPAVYAQLINTLISTTQPMTSVCNFTTAILLPAGYSVRIESLAATSTALLNIIGYTRPV